MAAQDTLAGAADAEALIMHTTDIVVSYVANNAVGAEQVPSLIRSIHDTLAGLGTETMEGPRPDPAVSVRSSVKKDHIVCLEDGKKFKMLKRHLMTDHQMSPGDYRAKWNLPADYPMVAPNYAAQRRDLAVKIGLGRKPAAAAKPARKARTKKGG